VGEVREVGLRAVHLVVLGVVGRRVAGSDVLHLARPTICPIAARLECRSNARTGLRRSLDGPHDDGMPKDDTRRLLPPREDERLQRLAAREPYDRNLTQMPGDRDAEL
jgi:hypothetical protein